MNPGEDLFFNRLLINTTEENNLIPGSMPGEDLHPGGWDPERF